MSLEDTVPALENKALSLRFGNASSGMALTSIRDLQRNQEQLSAVDKQPAIWRLTFREIADW